MAKMTAKKELLERAALMDEESAALVLSYAKSLAAAKNAPPQKKRRPNFQSRLAALREQVQKNPELWTVDSMAEKMSLTRSRFSVLYKKTFGASPDQEKRAFLNQKARLLLSSTEKTVQQIAAECGYNECENFIRAFRKSNGLSPLQFRKTEQGLEARPAILRQPLRAPLS